MAGDRNSQRERKKEMMRRNIVEGSRGKTSVPKAVSQATQKAVSQTVPQVVAKAVPKVPEEDKKYVRTAVQMLAALIAVIIFCFVIYQQFRAYSTYRVAWSTDVNSSSSLSYGEYAGGMLLAGRDGVSRYDDKGEEVWGVPYEMNNPILVTEGSYILVYDYLGRSIVICDKNGRCGTVSTSYPVSKADISAGGVVAAVLEDERSNVSYISYYRNNGEKLEVEIRTPLATNGYPLDISISPNGQQLMVCYYAIGGGIGSCRVDFYDFEKGKEMPNRLVGSFSYADDDTYIPILEYAENNQAFAVGTNRLLFYSAADRLAIEELGQIINGEIRRVFYNDQYLGIVVDENDGLKIRVYEISGRQIGVIEQESLYEDYCFDDRQIIMNSDSYCRIIDFTGKEKFGLEFQNGIDRIVPAKGRMSYYLVSANALQKITLK